MLMRIANAATLMALVTGLAPSAGLAQATVNAVEILGQNEVGQATIGFDKIKSHFREYLQDVEPRLEVTSDRGNVRLFAVSSDRRPEHICNIIKSQLDSGCRVAVLPQVGLVKMQFFGSILLEPLPDGRKMKTHKQLTFADSTGATWHVPEGTEVDGASIPEFLWSFAGSPWTGKYRIASVLHDYYCEHRNRDWRSTHRMFYDAMLADGVSSGTAKIFYSAVYRFGPRWRYDSTPCYFSCAQGAEVGVEITPSFDQRDWEHILSRLQTEDLSIEAIEDLVDRSLSKDEAQLQGSLIIDGADYERIKIGTAGALRRERAYEHYIKRKILP